MPQKKAVRAPSRQLTRTPAAAPARRRVEGADTVALPPNGTATAAVAPRAAAPAAVAPRAAAPAVTRGPAPMAPRGARSTVAAMPQARRAQVPAAGSTLRNLRGRVAQQIQGMDLADEMAWIRSDIGHLAILAVGGFVILIVLAFVLPAMGL